MAVMAFPMLEQTDRTKRNRVRSMDIIHTIYNSLGITEFVKPSIGITDVLDILIVAYIIYKVIFWIKETRAWVLFKGILVIFAFAAVAAILKLHTIIFVLSNTINMGIIALLIVFQPEMRKALEQLGKGKIFSYFTRSEDTGDEKAAARTPLHDGAVIIRRNRVAAATCFLPLTDSNEVSMELGTRHRAAIGASEVSDAHVIVVSEETGKISVARGGVLYRDLTTEQLESMISQQEGGIRKKRAIWKGRQTK